MKLGMIITQTDPETVFNALRLALYSLEQGDEVRISSPSRDELQQVIALLREQDFEVALQFGNFRE